MSEEIFEIYEFIKDNHLETHCYDYENIGRQIIVFVRLLCVEDFFKLLSKNIANSLDEGGYEVRIITNGDLGIDLMDIINNYCLDEECDKWFNRFKKYSSECC